jgi:hypothetical protein
MGLRAYGSGGPAVANTRRIPETGAAILQRVRHTTCGKRAFLCAMRDEDIEITE